MQGPLQVECLKITKRTMPGPRYLCSLTMMNTTTTTDNMYQEKEPLYGLFQLSQRDRESILRSITPVITAFLSSYDSFGTALDTFSGLSPTSAAGAHLAQVPVVLLGRRRRRRYP